MTISVLLYCLNYGELFIKKGQQYISCTRNAILLCVIFFIQRDVSDCMFVVAVVVIVVVGPSMFIFGCMNVSIFTNFGCSFFNTRKHNIQAI